MDPDTQPVDDPLPEDEPEDECDTDEPVLADSWGWNSGPGGHE